MIISTEIKAKFSKLKGVILIVIIWHLVYLVVQKDYLVPSVFETFKRFILLFFDMNSILNIVITLYRMIVSFFISFTFAIIFGTLAGKSESLEHLFNPFVNVFRSTPTMSIILLSLIWLGSEGTAIFVCVLIVFPIVYENILIGIKSVDKKYLEMAKIYKLTKYKILKNIYIPSIKPFILSSISLGLGLNLKVLIAAEVLSQPNLGIGSRLYNSKIAIDTEGIFAWSIVVILVTSLVEKFILSKVKSHK